MFNEKLQPYYQGRVLMNESALNDPVLIAVLDEMALRDFKDRPDQMRVLGTSQTGTNYEQATNVHKRRYYAYRQIQQI